MGSEVLHCPAPLYILAPHCPLRIPHLLPSSFGLLSNPGEVFDVSLAFSSLGKLLLSHGLGFPSALEALRAGSSHIPSQVGQVAGFLAKAWCGIFRANPVWVLLFYLLAQKDSEARHFPAVPAWPARVLFPEGERD